MMSHLSENYILIMVEDDEGHALLIRKNLERAGIGNEIVHFSDGAAALAYFFDGHTEQHRREKSLVLLDLNLPEVDGYEVLRQLKSSEATKNIPVIVLTTTDSPREIDQCYALGCNVYITKPVDYDSFSDAIRKLGLMLAVVKVPHVRPA
jgi:CheY-like chemotaxis protein